MRGKIRLLLKQAATAFRRQTDPEIEEIRHDIEALDSYLKIQNLRRAEEKRFRRIRDASIPKEMQMLCLCLLFLVVPSFAHAAELEGTLRNLVTAFTGRILPVLALGYLGKNIFSHVSGDPNAKQESVRVVLGIACLLGLSGVWSFIASQAR